MKNIFDVMIVVVVFSACYGIIKLFVHRKERLVMIEKGANMPDFKNEGFSFSSLKFGIFFFGIGLGVLMANILTVTTKLDREVAYFSMIFLFGGLSLIIHHLIEGKSKKV
jgi:lipoprotein signal peptidase